MKNKIKFETWLHKLECERYGKIRETYDDKGTFVCVGKYRDKLTKSFHFTKIYANVSKVPDRIVLKIDSWEEPKKRDSFSGLSAPRGKNG